MADTHIICISALFKLCGGSYGQTYIRLVQICPQVGADQGRKVLLLLLELWLCLLLLLRRLTGKITYLLYILCIQRSGLFIAPRFSQYYFHYYCHYYCY